MKKTYAVENLDCAHCAGKIESAVKKIEGVKSASVNFLTGKFKIEADDDDFDSVLEKSLLVFKKIEPNCEVKVR